MDIDPRLRGEQSPQTAYPPPPNPVGQYPSPSAPSSGRIPIAHQQSEQHLHDDSPYQSMYPPPHTPQSAGSIGQGESQGGDHSNGTPTGDPNDPKRPRACEACRGLKVRCEPDPNNPEGPCKRCTKANRNCVVTVPSRKRQKKTDSRVAELEKKIDALTQSLQASKADMIEPEIIHSYGQVTHGGYISNPRSVSGQRSGSNEWASQLERFAHSGDHEGRGPPPMVMAGQKRKHSEGKEFTKDVSGVAEDNKSSGPYAFNRPDGAHGKAVEGIHTFIPSEYTDVVDRGVITPETATAMFERYITEMAPHMPAVVFPVGTTAFEIRKTKPILFLAILSAASGTNHPDIQRVMTKEVMQIFADRIICQGEKTLELIQALQVSTLWYWPPEHFEEMKFYQLIHIAAVMAIDCGLSRKRKAAKPKAPPGLWRDHTWRRTPFPDPESVEARRAWLGCYFLSCNASMGLRRSNLIRWTSYMQECTEVLESSPEALPSDKLLCQWVKSQHIAEEVGIQFSMDDPFATVTIADQKVQYALKGFEMDLEHWSSQVPPDVQGPSLKMSEHVVNLYMHEVSLHVDHNVEEFKPPFTEEGLRGNTATESDRLSSAHINALSSCLSAIDGIFETFLSLDVEVIRALPIFHFIRVAYAVVVLIKMFFAAATPNSELGKVINKDNMKVEYYLDGLLETFRATAENEKSRPASKFLMVLVMLKTWFHRQKDGKVPPLYAGQTAGLSGVPEKEREKVVSTYDALTAPAATTDPQNHPAPTQQRAQQNEYSSENTPLQLLSEVATGNQNHQQSRPESRAQNQNPASRQSDGWTPQPLYNYANNVLGAPVNTAPMNMVPDFNGYGNLGLDIESAMGDGFEQAMGMTLDVDVEQYFSHEPFFSAMMDSVGGAQNIFEGS